MNNTNKLLALSALVAVAPLSQAADVEAGRAKVAMVCAACHGVTGVSVSGIAEGPPAPTLFRDERAEKRRRVEEVAAKIADRYGDEGAVTRATLLGRPTRS